MKKFHLENRQIRVFISSTFNDMQGERDYLMKRTFPKLRQIAAQRDVILTELDLRWGITEEESRTGKVVDICFREIENSVPFFIGIIGNRYGWIPRAEDLGGNVTERFPAVTNYLDKHLSVTEMEMQFGVLERKEDMHAFFFIKEPEGTSDNLYMLRRLKETIRASRYPSSNYTDLTDLAEQVEVAFISLLDELFPEQTLTEHQKEKMIQRSFIRKLSATYVKDEANFKQLSKFAETSGASYLVVTGESGMGKSSFLANWAKENEHTELYSVIPYFSSNGGNEIHSHIVKYLADEICEQFGLELGQVKEEERLQSVFDLLAVRTDQLVIIIDAINQIADIGQSKMLNWLPIPPKNVKFIFSTLTEDKTMQVFKDRGYPIFVLQKMNTDQRRSLIKDYLHAYGKKLEENQIQRILADHQCENTLVLKTLLDEIICSGRHDTLDGQIGYYLHSSSVADFYGKVITRFEGDFGSVFVKNVLGLIAVSRNGVSEEVLIQILGVKRLDWSDFYCSFSTHLNNQSGLLVFTHSFITSTVWDRYLEKDPDFEKVCRRQLSDSLQGQFSDYSMQEIPYQLDRLKDWDSLHDYITTYRYLVFCMNYDEVEIGTYWRHIFKAMPEKYSLEDYLTCPGAERDDAQLYVKLLRLCRVLYRTKPRKVFVRELLRLINEKPELASSKVYLALSDSTARPDSIDYANRSLEICRKNHDVLGEIESLRMLGSTYYDACVKEVNDDYGQKAYDVWEEALHLSIGLYGEVHPLVMHAYKDMGIMSTDLDKGLELTLKAVDLGIIIYGKDHPLVGRPYHYAGCIYREKKEWEKALYYFQEACRVWTPAYGINHEIMNSSYGNQGKALMNMGRLDEALACYDTCLRIQENIFEEKDYDYAICEMNRAFILAQMGRKDEAIQTCDKIEVVLKKEKVAAEKRSQILMDKCKSFRISLTD